VNRNRHRHTRINMLLMFLLVCAFAAYNLVVYTTAGSDNPSTLSPKAIYGKKLWQENNCNSCHQLYGLGGYMGPDLTNIYTAPGKGPQYIKGILNSSIRAMPRFQFNKIEAEALVSFLKEVDRSGYYPNYQAATRKNGWVEIKYKHEK